jgi:PAS domain S-box-containing protein
VTGTALARGFLSTRLFLVGALMLALSMVSAIVFAVGEEDSDRAVRAGLVAEQRLADLIATVREADDALRGDFITGSPVSLAHYATAMSSLTAQTASLEQLSPTPDDTGRIARIRQIASTRIAQMRNVMALIQASNMTGARAQISADIQSGVMSNLHDLVNAQRAAEQAGVGVAQDTAESDGWWMLGSMLAAMAVAGLLMTGTFRAGQLTLERLRTAKAELSEVNAELEAKVLERTATLNASEARFRLLAETLPGIVYMAGPDGRGNFLNREACCYSGLDAASIHERSWMAFVHPDDLPGSLQEWETAQAQAADFEMEFRLRRFDGAYRWFLARTVAVKDAGGAVMGWIGAAIDIDDRKTTEMALTQAKAELERRVAERSADLDRIFTLSADIFTVSDLDFRFITISPAWERILGRKPDEVMGGSHLGLIHPADLPATLSARLRLMLGQPCAYTNRFRHADGSWRWLSWRAVPVRQEGRIYGVARDVSTDHEREEQLRQRQKMEVVGQLTGGVAHDFNNLLTIIMGSLELLRNTLPAGGAPQRRLEVAADAARRAAALTHRLLSFARQQPLEPKPLDVGQLLDGMLDLLHRTLGEGVDVTLTAAPGLWFALADANQLENAILNLAVNARDAMAGSGQLRIETVNTSVLATEGDLQQGDYVRIMVSDTGCGMTPEVQARIFEPFFSTKPLGQGTGLGLAQVYGFIKQSGGHVSVTSAPGQGTAIRLYLPRAQMVPAESGEAQAVADAPSPRQGAVALVVEDEVGVCQFSAEVLAGLGFTVRRAASAEEALVLCEQLRAVALLFTDIVLGAGRSGIELAAELLVLFPEAAVLYTSGYSQAMIPAELWAEIEPRFIAKPFTAAALAAKVGEIFPHAP